MYCSFCILNRSNTNVNTARCKCLNVNFTDFLRTLKCYSLHEGPSCSNIFMRTPYSQNCHAANVLSANFRHVIRLLIFSQYWFPTLNLSSVAHSHTSPTKPRIFLALRYSYLCLLSQIGTYNVSIILTCDIRKDLYPQNLLHLSTTMHEKLSLKMVR